MNVWGNLKMGRCVKNWVAVGKKALHKWEPFVSLFKNMHIYCFTNSLPQKWHCVKVDASSTSFPPTHQKCDCMWALCCCNVCVCRVGLGGRGLAVCAANRVWSWCSRLCSQRRSDTGCFFFFTDCKGFDFRKPHQDPSPLLWSLVLVQLHSVTCVPSKEHAPSLFST